MSHKTRSGDVRIPLYRRRACTLLAMERAVLDDLFDGFGHWRIGQIAVWPRPLARTTGLGYIQMAIHP
nr:hypothetical protein [Thioalkalivibrio sp. HK1]